MKDVIKKGLFTGFGLALIAKEKLRDVAKDIVKEAELSEDEGKKLYETLQKKSDSYKVEAEEKIEKMIESVLEKMNIPTKKELEELTVKVEKMQTLLDEMKKNNEIID